MAKLRPPRGHNYTITVNAPPPGPGLSLVGKSQKPPRATLHGAAGVFARCLVFMEGGGDVDTSCFSLSDGKVVRKVWIR